MQSHALLATFNESDFLCGPTLAMVYELQTLYMYEGILRKNIKSQGKAQNIHLNVSKNLVRFFKATTNRAFHSTSFKKQK